MNHDWEVENSLWCTSKLAENFNYHLIYQLSCKIRYFPSNITLKHLLVPSVEVKEGLSCVIFRDIWQGKSRNLALP